MASVQEIADWIVSSFDMKESTKLDVLVERVLRQRGAHRFAASSEAIAKTDRVLYELQSRRPEDLPFDFHASDEYRLIGKQRIRPSDSAVTAEIRGRLALSVPMLDAVYNCGDLTFERICAGVMHLSGATVARATCSPDDGGIDIYGRIPLRNPDPLIARNLIGTTILNKGLLFLGQCKCHDPKLRIGRPDLDNFHGAVKHCLSQYEGNHHPPNQRVPPDFYRAHETCVQLFFTTGEFADTAIGAANAMDTILINGYQIAQFLIYHKIGVSVRGRAAIDQSALAAWAYKFGPASPQCSIV